MIYFVAARGDSVHALTPAGDLVSPQGMVVPPSGGDLYVADYAQGILRVDLSNGRVRLLPSTAHAMLLGIDGLVWHRGRLIGIQNGARPQRVLALDLRGDDIAGVRVLERAHPDYDEPTTGVVVGDHLYYIANGQWGRLTEGSASQPVVLAMPLREDANR